MLPLARQVDILARLTERARTYFDIYKFIVGEETRPLIIEQMNDFLWYFRIQDHVLRYALFVELGGLFDNDRKVICLHSVLIRAKSSIKNDVYNDISDRLKGVSGLADKVRLLRNKAFAHRDSETDFDQAFEKAKVTLNDLEKMLEVAREVSDVLCEKFNQQKPVIVTLETLEDCKRLFRRLGSEIH